MVNATKTKSDLRIEQVTQNRTSQEEGLAPAVTHFLQQRGQAPLPDLFYLNLLVYLNFLVLS